MKPLKYVLLISLFFVVCVEADAQKLSKKKKKKGPEVELPAFPTEPMPYIWQGPSSVVDYVDSLKLKDTSYVQTVSNARLQDSTTITILLEGTSKGKKLVLSPNKSFSEHFKDRTLLQHPGWVNPSREFSKSFINSKGYKVEIQFPGRDDKFYGVLEFNKVYKACAGDPSARSYFIKVPPAYIDNAAGGNISVVYEYYECIPRGENKMIRDYTCKKSRYTSWVLWISDISFEE